jgi:hypothetical protein
MTTGSHCSKGCGNVAARRGGTCRGCGIEEIANPLWRSVRRAVHNTFSPDLPATDASGIVWFKGGSAGPDGMYLRCNDAATDVEASALDRGASGAEAPVPALPPVRMPAGRPEPAISYDGGPAIKRASPQTPGWWTSASPEQKQAWKRMDTDLAGQLRYDRPYTHGPHVGTCPGTEGSGRGHGLTASTVHWGDCCQTWDEAREQAVADGMAVPSEADRAVVTADVARWEAAQAARAAARGAEHDREAAS